jgi:hypothetical protein
VARCVPKSLACARQSQLGVPLSDPHNCAQFRFSTTRGYSDNIERERARERQETGTNQHRVRETFPEASKGQTRDRVAAATGIGSGCTYDKAAKVWEAGENLLAEDGRSRTATGHRAGESAGANACG